MKTYAGSSLLSLRLSFVLGIAAVASAQSTTITSVNAATYLPIVAPDSLVSGWGSNFTPTLVVANVTSQGSPIVLPTTLGGITLSNIDSSKATLTPSLYMVSPGQINYVLPSATALGAGTLSLGSSSSPQGTLLVSMVSPGIFTADGSGTGVPAAQVLRVSSGGVATIELPFETGSATYVPSPISLINAPGDTVYLMLYGTGFRHHSLNPVIATVGGVSVPVQYAGTQTQYPGLDQVNLGPLPQTLTGKGLVNVVIKFDGVPANTSSLQFR